MILFLELGPLLPPFSIHSLDFSVHLLQVLGLDGLGLVSLRSVLCGDVAVQKRLQTPGHVLGQDLGVLMLFALFYTNWLQFLAEITFLDGFYFGYTFSPPFLDLGFLRLYQLPHVLLLLDRDPEHLVEVAEQLVGEIFDLLSGLRHLEVEVFSPHPFGLILLMDCMGGIGV